MIKNKYLSFFPFLLTAVVFGFTFYHINTNLLPINYIENLIFSLGDLVPLQMLGFTITACTGVSWYLSALLVVSFIIYPLLCKDKNKKFVNYIAPILVFVIYGFLAKNYNDLTATSQWYYIIYMGLLRGFAGICLGCIAYNLTAYISAKSFSKSKTIFITIIEVICYLLTIAFCATSYKYASFGFVIIPFAFVAIVLSFSEKTYLNKLFNHQLFNWLGVFSFSLYLNHFYIANNLKRLITGLNNNSLLLIYLGTTVLLSIINYVLGKCLLKLIHKKKVAPPHKNS